VSCASLGQHDDRETGVEVLAHDPQSQTLACT
jgi:hypothetical protein